MCDFSLQAVASRPAVVGEKLVVTDFRRGTRGFASPVDRHCAVCLQPGTELVFENSGKVIAGRFKDDDVGCTMAIFCKLNEEHIVMHHDALAFSNGTVVLLTLMEENQIATVLQLPHKQKTKTKKQRPAPPELVREMLGAK